MPILTTARTFEPGPYSIVAVPGTGTVQLQISVDGGSFVDITNGAYSEATTDVIDIPLCQLQAALTGDAQVSLNKLLS